MQCLICNKEDSKVVDSRSIHSGVNIRRRRECNLCGFRFTTYEYTLKYPVMIIKKNGDREEYERIKIEKSFRIACNKRPIPESVIQESIIFIEEKITNSGKMETNAKEIASLENVNGFLIGSASLKPNEFYNISKSL